MPSPAAPLTTQDHRRDAAGMRYVYPVVSRRAGGVSIGINLNPNNACNWRCIYCQVPDLTRGAPPPVDVAQLADELRRLLDDILHGNFMSERVAPEARRLIDIAFSGNGEPTSAAEFPQAIDLAAALLAEKGLAGEVRLRLITNGSLLDRESVRAGIAALGHAGGEVWFKLDAASPIEWQRINGTRQRRDVVLRRLKRCCDLCDTWVQSCFFSLDGAPPEATALDDYIGLLEEVAGRIAGVHLYGLARPSLQPEAPRLGRLEASWFEDLAGRIRRLGLTVQVSP